VRKNILLGSGVLVLTLLIAGVWLFFKNNSVSDIGTPTPLNQQGVIETPPFTQIADQTVSAFFVTKNENVVYIDTSGVIYRNGTAISTAPVPNISSVAFSSDGHRILINQRDLIETFVIFNIDSTRWEWTLPQETRSASWSPISSDQLAYITDAGIFQLDLLSGKNTLLTKAKQYGVNLHWVTSDTILLAEQPLSQTKTSVWAYSLSDNSFSKLFEGLDILIRPIDAFSFIKQSEGDLGVFDSSGIEILKLPFGTLPSKCDVANNHVSFYCGIPNVLLEKQQLKAYFKGERFTNDVLQTQRLLPDSGDIQNTRIPLGDVDINALQAFNNTIYFINRLDNKLYALPLSRN